MALKLRETTFAIVDVETTGVDPAVDLSASRDARYTAERELQRRAIAS